MPYITFLHRYKYYTDQILNTYTLINILSSQSQYRALLTSLADKYCFVASVFIHTHFFIRKKFKRK